MSDVKNAMVALMHKRNLLAQGLVAPARAAANQMKDAGMNRGAEPLAEALFELDALEQEIRTFVEENFEAVLEEAIRNMQGGN